MDRGPYANRRLQSMLAAITVMCGYCATLLGDSSLREAAPVTSSWLRVEENGKWCGAKSLWLISRGYGADHELGYVKSLCDPEGNSDGLLSIASLERAATKMGLFAKAVHCRLDWLKHNRLPAITVHRTTPQSGQSLDPTKGNHCLVLLEHRDGHFYFLDPYLPAKVLTLPDEKFSQTWAGYALLIGRRSTDLPGNSWGLVFCAGAAIANVLVWGSVFLGWRYRKAVATAAVLLASSLFGCSRPQETATFLEFDHTRFEADGVLVDAGGRPSVRHNFPFVNASQRPVKITGVQPSCSCSVVGFPREEIQPGEQGAITLVVDLSNRVGRFESSALVSLDGGAEACPVVLWLSAFVLPPAFTRPAALRGYPKSSPLPLGEGQGVRVW